MKERKRFREIYVGNIVIFVIVFFILGFFMGWLCKKPLDEKQFELCEQIAQDVYNQKGNIIVEAPEEYEIKLDTTSITVRLDNFRYRGKVIAKLQNGELVFIREMETVEADRKSVV